ncbi:MAG: serine/threonine protein kinase [Planctomycetes bacterium]|nr:serine/threonine protein kinase [Planctomycetota bacterium]MBI3844918.1 serine/threonine protein kinase [Planctomycetota bacterium]
MSARRDETPPPGEIDVWHLKYIQELDEGARETPDEFARRIPDERVRAAVLERLRLFARAYRALVAAPGPSSTALPEVPGYHIEREVGRGGSGTVYFARSDRFPEGVAIKILPLLGASAQDRHRSAREFHVLAELGHPSIVRIRDMGELPLAFYLVMEWIDGISLAAVIEALRGEDPEGIATTQASTILTRVWRRVAPLSAEPRVEGTYLEWVVGAFQSLAEGLAQVHSRGIVHRDISPSNMMIRRADATPVFLDFGLARRLGSPHFSATGDLVGKPHYVAPEHARGLRTGSNPRADVYALTSVLYEMVTLRHPFDGSSTREILRRIARQDPTAPRRWNGAVTPELQTVILWGLEKTPSRRIPSAQALAEELRRLRRGERTLASRTRVLRIARRAARRAAPVAIGLSLVVVTVALFLVAGWPGRRRDVNDATPASIGSRLRFMVGDVVQQGGQTWVTALAGGASVLLPLPVRALSGGADDSDPDVAIAELDGDPDDEIVVVEDGGEGWDLAAYDLNRDRRPTRLWTLRQRSAEIAAEIDADSLEPGPIVCGDINGRGRTSAFLCMHDPVRPRTILVRVDPDESAPAKFTLPGRVGDLPGSFYVEEFEGSAGCGLVVVGRDATETPSAFVLTLDPSSFPGELREESANDAFRRGTLWNVPDLIPSGDASPTLPEAATFDRDGVGFVRVECGVHAITSRLDEQTHRIFGSEGPARSVSFGLSPLAMLRDDADDHMPGKGEPANRVVRVHAFGLEVRGPKPNAVAALRLVSRSRTVLRLHALSHDGSAASGPAAAVAFSVPSRPRESSIALLDAEARVGARLLFPRWSLLSPEVAVDDGGIDAMRVVSLDAVKFNGASEASWVVGLTSHVRGALVFLGADLAAPSPLWFPGPLLDVRARDVDHEGRVGAIFRYATASGVSRLCGFVDVQSVPQGNHMCLPGEPASTELRRSCSGVVIRSTSGTADREGPRISVRRGGWLVRAQGSEIPLDDRLRPVRETDAAFVEDLFEASPRLLERDSDLLRWVTRPSR